MPELSSFFANYNRFSELVPSVKAKQSKVTDRNDYYPGGMIMPGRSYIQSTKGYRYGFNGKEKDNESIVQYDYGFRIYDPRLVRFKSVDPLTKKYPELTPYQFASNSPVWGVDLDGLELRVYTEIEGITGHAFLTVGSGKDMIVYSFGRYAGVYKTSGVTSGTLSPTGPGVMVRLTGDNATKFVRNELVNNKAKSFEIKDGDEAQTKGYMDKLFNSSMTLPKVGAYKDDPEAHIIGDYSLFGNSCVTKTIDGAKASGTQLDFTSLWSLTPGGASTDPNASPLGLQVYLESEAGGKTVKDVTKQVKNDYTEFKTVSPLNSEHPISDHPEDNQAKRNTPPIDLMPKKKS